MSEAPINLAVVPLALEHVDTNNFEWFAQAFYAAQIGRDFVPLGGMHDGGAEGYLDPELFGDAEAKHFLQVSKQQTYRRKIRDTVKRLRDYGRAPVSLAYVTSITIPDLDKEEQKLSDELNCAIRIRDGKYIQAHVNSKDSNIAAFNSFLKPAISYLFDPGAANVAPRAQEYVDRTLAVFLRQEVDQRRGKSDLLESVADSLIIWALSETDPETKRFMGRDEILSRIEAALPSAKQFVRGVLDSRLLKLRAKENTAGRQVRYYSKDDNYCLPFETRELVAAENIADDSLKISVTEVIKSRLSEKYEELDSVFSEEIVRICHDVLQRLFEKQGLQVAQFVSDGDQDDELYANAAILINASIDGDQSLVSNKSELRRVSTFILRQTFYDGTEEERLYLEKLSKTYVLLMLLKNEPKIVEYFKNISSKFILYIGTDFLVRAISEHYLDAENQTTRNLFGILVEAGAKLVLTQKVVEELATHIRSQIYEFENTYSYVEHKIPVEMVENISRILIRSYFYARLAPMSDVMPPKGWRSYIENFASYSSIKNNAGDDELARYLIGKFGFSYETTKEMEDSVNSEDVLSLTDQIVRTKSENGRGGEHLKTLAYNDALHVYRVYAVRDINNESSPANPFGFRTWWLTLDSGVRRAAGPVVAKKSGQRFIMRPEFLLNFISFAPTTAEVEFSYRTIFPSVLGIKLSNRVADHTFRDVVRSANDMWSVDEARAGAIIADLTDKLKGDTMKVYENEW